MNRGITTDETTKAFESKWILDLEKRPPWDKRKYKPTFVFVACDPKGTGSGPYASEMAIVSIFFHEGKIIVRILLFFLLCSPTDSHDIPFKNASIREKR